MFGRKNKATQNLHNTKAETNNVSTKDSDMTSGSRSTKSCGGKCATSSGAKSCGGRCTKSSATKSTASKASSAKVKNQNKTKACS